MRWPLLSVGASHHIHKMKKKTTKPNLKQLALDYMLETQIKLRLSHIHIKLKFRHIDEGLGELDYNWEQKLGTISLDLSQIKNKILLQDVIRHELFHVLVKDAEFPARKLIKDFIIAIDECFEKQIISGEERVVYGLERLRV